MTIERSTDAARINAILNHPDVRPWVVSSDDAALDVTAAAANPRDHFLLGEHGVFLCFWLMDGLYEAHAAVLMEGRGEWTRDFGANALIHMFTQTDAVELLTRVPQGHPACLALVKLLGFSMRWERPLCRFRGREVPYSVWSLTMQDWMSGVPRLHQLAISQMQRSGLESKARAWHNRWALLSREPTI